MSVPDLAAWLLEQIAEDERVAFDGSPLDAVTDHVWKVIDTREQGPGIGQVNTRMVVTRTRESLVARLGMDRERRVSTHIARWNPRRVLAECDAKRQLVNLHAELGHAPCDAHGPDLRSIPCEVLELLALPYADRAGYREEWRP